MKTKVKVTINGMDFTLVGEKSEEHLQKVAEVVNTKVEELNGSELGLSTVAATILAAANIADELLTEKETGETLREQIKNYFDEISALKDENAELRRELARLSPDASKTPAWEERQSKLDLGEDNE